MIKNIFVVGSGKGGVGKSTISVNLAIAMAKKKLNIGLLDADIYGPSIPKMLGITSKPEVSKNKKILPYDKYDIKSISIANMIPDNSAVIWRGAMASSAIRQLYNDVDWGELDYLIIDLPPGTGDIQLSISQNFSILGAVVVSTPQQVSLIDVRKSINMFKKVNVPILGLIQNMSYLELDGKKNYLFGKNGVLDECKNNNLNFLGEVPLIPSVTEACDIGVPIFFNKNCNDAKSFEKISENILESLKRTKTREVKIET
tara:strand:- start:56 stop:829 length:774 start_codon:yes stop_codon:yes gene_type:complete